MSAVFLGVDIGTSGCKALLLGEDRVLGSETATYPVLQPNTGWSEQNPDDWYGGVRRAVSRVLEAAGSPDIAGIGLSGQMHGLVALDGAGDVIRPAILWNDQRNSAECADFIAKMGGLDALLAETRNGMLTGYTGGKIIWLRDNEPSAYSQISHILNPKDYIRLRLTGVHATEFSDASGTGLFSVDSRRWSDAALEAAGIPKSILPEVFESTAQTATLNASAASDLGLPCGIPVYGGGGDAVIQTLGAGVISPGDFQLTIGTAGIVAGLSPSPIENPDGRLQVFCDVLPDRWHVMGVSLNAGGALAWFEAMARGLNGCEESEPDFALMARLANQSEPGAKGVRFLPYLNGERCPHPDPDASGAFVGLRADHSAQDMARSVLEGVSYSLADIARLMKARGLSSSRIFASGGGIRDPGWCQMIADIFGTQVQVGTLASHGAALGAAIVAGLGAGVWSDPADALPRDDTTYYEVDEVRHATYRGALQHYQSLYPGVAKTVPAEVKTW